LNDREIFRKNLNDFLFYSGKKQKDLAEFVGAKTTTVSGWTRGISYPRADAMEKIALFFGVSTSRLVGSSESVSSPVLCSSYNELTPEEQRLLDAFRAADDRARSDALATLLQHPATNI